MNPFTQFINTISGRIADTIAGEVKAGLAPVVPYIRRLSIGAVLILVSALGWIFGLLFLLISLFVELANLQAYTQPAAITGGVSLAVAVALALIGLSLVRKPR